MWGLELSVCTASPRLPLTALPRAHPRAAFPFSGRNCQCWCVSCTDCCCFSFSSRRKLNCLLHLFPRKSGLRVLKPLSAKFNQFYNVSLKNLMWAISEELKEWFGASPFPPPLLAPSPAGPIPHIPKRGYRATVSLVQDKLLGTEAEGGGKERFEHHQELSKAAKMSIRFLVSHLGSMSFGVQNSGFKCCIPLKLQMFKSNALADRNLSTDNSVISCCCLLLVSAGMNLCSVLLVLWHFPVLLSSEWKGLATLDKCPFLKFIFPKSCDHNDPIL